MRNKTRTSRKPTQTIEPLEPRALLSATYTTVDLTRLVSHGATDLFQSVGITNTGLIAFNDYTATYRGDQGGYIYSLSGHRLYSAPIGAEVEAVINNGSDAYSSPNGTVIDFDGQLHTVSLSSTASEDKSFGATAMNNAGEFAGTEADFYPSLSSSVTAYVPDVFNASASQVPTTLSGSVYVNGISPRLNDAGQMIVYEMQGGIGGTMDNAIVYNLNTQSTIDITPLFKSGTTVTGADINQNGLVIGNYQRGRSVGGIFEFNTSNNALTLIPNAAGEVFTANAISDNGTIVGQVQSAVRVRNHVRTALHAASFTSTGTVTDLDAQSAPPTGVTLTEATGVNTSGDILANGTDASGVQHVYLLEPNT